MKVTLFTPEGTQDVDPAKLPELLAEGKAPLWVDMTGPTPDDIHAMREVFRFHPLAIEDTLNQRQRPKIEEYSGYFFMIFNPVTYSRREFDLRELDVFVGPGYVVTVHEGPEPAVDLARRRLAEGQNALARSPGYLAYVLMDTVIDDYFPVLDALGEAIEQLEDEVMANPRRELLAELFDIKHMLLEMWRVLWPQRDVFNQVAHHSLPQADQEALQHYLRDVTDHLLWIADMVSTFRDTLSSIMDLYMSAISNRLNQVVNRLTVFALIIGVMTVIGGFYGMNFAQTWPPFNASWGVPLVTGLMVILSGTLLLFFRKKGWF